MHMRRDLGSWGLTAVLTASLLAGCETDNLTDSAREAPPTEAAPGGDLRTRAELEGLRAGAVATPHFADGYVWAFNPTSASYSAASSYSFNRSGGGITITRPAGTTGQYTVRFAGLSALLGAKSTVKVTGYFPDNAYCKPTSPKLASNIVKVRCFNGTTGAPVNAYYTVFVTRNYVELAFAHAQLPTGNNYAPLASASWNPAGGIRVFRFSTGEYQVKFLKLGSRLTSNGGHVQVSVINTGGQHCKVRGWGGSPDLLINIGCMKRNGTPQDLKFNVLFLMPNNHLGYAWADQPSAASYTPSSFYSHNSSGGGVSITRSSTGKYTVTWSGLGADLLDGGDVQVTAYGGGTAQCKVESWGSQSANVRCFAPNGALVDSFYDVFLGS
jgi:hypothetical protein